MSMIDVKKVEARQMLGLHSAAVWRIITKAITKLLQVFFSNF